MSIKITLSGELLSTQLTLIMVLLDVKRNMLLQLFLTIEQLPTILTAEHCHTSMRQRVLNKLASAIQYFPTLLTLKLSDLCSVVICFHIGVFPFHPGAAVWLWLLYCTCMQDALVGALHNTAKCRFVTRKLLGQQRLMSVWTNPLNC